MDETVFTAAVPLSSSSDWASSYFASGENVPANADALTTLQNEGFGDGIYPQDELTIPQYEGDRTVAADSGEGWTPPGETGLAEELRNKPPASQERSIGQVLKDAGLSDKVIASVIQAGSGMLAGASAGKMKQAQWDREDKAIKTERDRRTANSAPGKVSGMSWAPPVNTGLLASIPK